MVVERIPEVTLNSGHKMPVIGLGTSNSGEPLPPSDTLVSIFIDAIEVGYRLIDSASVYETEEAIDQAVAKTVEQGLLKSRDEFSSLQRRLGMDYVDLYLIHWPLRLRHDLKNPVEFTKEDLLPFDIEGTWKAMEECTRLGLAKSIGIYNYGAKKLTKLLEIATIPPAVLQIEMNPSWQQEKLREFCKQRGIHVSAWAPLGSYNTSWGSGAVMENPIIQDIAMAKKKTKAQVALRWAYQQGSSANPKSFVKEWMIENLDIFDFELSEEELERMKQIPQRRGYTGDFWLSENGPCRTLEELWDGDP